MSFVWGRDDQRTTRHLPSGCRSGMYSGTLRVSELASVAIEHPREDVDVLKVCRQPAAKVLEVGPVWASAPCYRDVPLTVPVEPVADLGGDVGQVERLVHGFLGDLGVGGRDHVAAVVPALKVCDQRRAAIGLGLHPQSFSFARNISGTESSSWKTDFDRSTLLAGGEGATSPARATSSGTGLAFLA